MGTDTGLWERLIEELQANWRAYLGTVIEIVLIVVLAIIIIFIERRIAKRLLKKKKSTLDISKQRRMDTVARLFNGAFKFVIAFIAIALVVGALGLGAAMNSMLAAAGIGSVLLSLGAQNLVKDLATGIFMVYENQFAVGDRIKIGDTEGTVHDFNLRTTTIQGINGELNTITNGSITEVTNFSRTDYTSYIDISVSYEGDIEKALSEMNDAGAEYFAEGDGLLLAPPEMMGVARLGAYDQVLRMSVKCKYTDHWAVERELTKRIKLRFDKSGIEIPYQKVVLIKN